VCFLYALKPRSASGFFLKQNPKALCRQVHVIVEPP
jgi:hypothetical protein